MTTKHATFLSILLIITQIACQLNVVNAHEITTNDEKRPTNQLAMQKQQQQLQLEQQKDQEMLLPQHKSVEETLPSYDSVSDATHQQNYQSSKNHESYDKINDVVDDVCADKDNSNKNDDNNNDDGADSGDDIDSEGAFELENDNDFEEDNFNELSNYRRKRDLLIFPNTRWCGRGNTADGRYNHLGGASLADKCCRRHDHCKHYITGMSTRYELFNYRPYTLSHCTCDRRFRTCLKMANDEDANTIGKLFFNMVQTQCFILRTEKICQKRAADGTCELEDTRQKAYIRTNKKF